MARGKYNPFIITTKIESLNERGYGIGSHNDVPVYILDSLPGEEMQVKVYARKKGVFWGEKVEVTAPAKFRVEPKESHFLSCSPWQIVAWPQENEYKEDLIKRFYSEEKLTLPEFSVINDENEYGYRNKEEFAFYGHDDEHVTFAVHQRGSNFHKDPIDSCILAPDLVNDAGKIILKFINDQKIQARQLKGIQLRYSFSEKKVIVIIFVKDVALSDKFSQENLQLLLDQEKNISGILVFHSDMRSPAFIETAAITSIGETYLTEKVLNLSLLYAHNGFFQINPPMFEHALKDIVDYITKIKDVKNLTAADIYAGVGTIGLAIADKVKNVIGVELTPRTQEYALKNADKNKITNFEFYEGSAEKIGLDYLANCDILVLDPPRAGVHPKIAEKITETKPKFVVYLSCNPKTQAQDVAKFIKYYNVKFFSAYNFYPHTPHVESLMILERK